MTAQRRVKLSALVSVLSGLVRGPESDCYVTGVVHDSRRVEPGDVFVAVPGERFDGHDFLPEAEKRGAAAAVVQAGRRHPAVSMPLVTVRDSRRALAELAAAFWGWPSRRMKVVGVTGTNGKTTTVALVASIAEAAGFAAARLGTLGLIRAGHRLETTHTTLEAPDLQRILAELADDGVEVVAMEVSSHGLALDRVWQTYFDVAVLTNITHDHLDFHRDFDDYAAAKARLFTDYAELAAGHKEMRAAVNLDDPRAAAIAARARCPVIGFGIEAEGAQVRATDIEFHPRGVRFTLHLPDGSWPVELRLVGRFNVENALAAAAAGVGLGFDAETIVGGLQAARAAPGRMEPVEAGQQFLVLVDYAHTPDALEKVLLEARRLTAGRLICVFGCGGDRDPAKRPKMGAIATAVADHTIITSDNPRTEEPLAIIEQIVAGVQGGSFEVVPDRRAAIRRAIAAAGPQDTVLIAGKGHEDYQIIGRQKIHFDDREEARAAIRELMSGAGRGPRR